MVYEITFTTTGADLGKKLVEAPQTERAGAEMKIPINLPGATDPTAYDVNETGQIVGTFTGKDKKL
jgi:hypothetical protein